MFSRAYSFSRRQNVGVCEAMCNTPAKNIGRSRHTSLADPHHWDVVDLHLRYSLIPPHFSPRTRKGATSLASHLLHFFQLQVQQLQGRRKRITQTDISTIHGHCKHAKTRVTHRIIKVAIFACIRIRMRGENLWGSRLPRKSMGHVDLSYDAWSGIDPAVADCNADSLLNTTRLLTGASMSVLLRPKFQT